MFSLLYSDTLEYSGMLLVTFIGHLTNKSTCVKSQGELL